MPVFQLPDDPVFPPVELSEANGLLALGGDLAPERLIMAYSRGIFPWFGEEQPILWWSPDPRLILRPEKLHVSRSMRQTLKQQVFTITYDHCFRAVTTACRAARREEGATWITEAMVEAYCRLHDQGIAHSVEAWHKGELAGGLYGVALGACFFGESMFTRVSNSSKAALITLTRALKSRGFMLIDCQVDSPHLQSLGAELVPRKIFLNSLTEALRQPAQQGSWADWA
jgi:leucyl/phenylalanyl-tRNA---protein transferase